MTTKRLATKFAPAERVSAQEISRQARLFAGKKLLGVLPDVVPCILLALNERRQIVFANERFLELLPDRQREDGVLGRRPGEVLGCLHAFEDDSGCGTTEACSTCGAVHAILSSQGGKTDVRECRILRGKNSEALDLRVWTTPVTADGESFTILAAVDISHEKRRQSLEHIFLHDICNVAYGLSWYAGFLKKKADPDQVEGYIDAVDRLSRQLTEEIDAQRILIRAETGELLLKPESLRSLQLVQSAVELYGGHPVSLDRRLCIDPTAEDVAVVGDRTLLSRVLCNMIKNALEACQAGETVTAGCVRQGDTVEFRVHNPGFIPREIQLQIFQRSFSTKGAGRGLGTYSIKLLTERYLHGRVSFTSTPEAGTVFKVQYPLAPDA
jgi:signal transduction histidine kinase